MNRRMILYLLGWILIIETGFMLLPLITALIYREASGRWFLYTMLGGVLLGLGMMRLARPRNRTIYTKDGMVIVALSWILLSLFGALPFSLSGEIPSYLDAVFETVSGFTTTGSSILPNVEALSHCMLLWRSFSHWLGGMGVLVFMLGILHMEGGQAIHLLRAESPGPAVSKMVPKMSDSVKILYGIYLALTLLQIVFYRIGGMPVFDSICHAVGTAGTGGFGIKAASLGAYDYYAQTVTTVFMLLFGVNFSVYFFILRRKLDLVWKNTELRWYLLIIAVAAGLLTVNILPLFPSVYDAFHHAIFAVASIITTSGFATVDFNLWPEFSRVILVLLMIMGACAGSTGGGMKVSRVIILIKSARSDLRRLVHPHTVKADFMDGKPLGRELVASVRGYFLIYAMIAVVSVLLISLDNFDGTTTLTSVITTMNNIGPGLNLIGPAGNFAAFSPLSKVVLCIDMLFGRLELYPMLVLMMPSTWSRR